MARGAGVAGIGASCASQDGNHVKVLCLLGPVGTRSAPDTPPGVLQEEIVGVRWTTPGAIEAGNRC